MNLRKRIQSIATHVVLALVSFIGLIPFLLVAVTSLKDEVIAFSMPPKWFFTPTFRNYAQLLGEIAFLRTVMNSIIIAGTATLIGTIIGILGGYGFSRFEFKGKGFFSRLLLTFRAVPAVIYAVPYFLIWRALSLADTHFAMIIIYTTLVLPLLTWLIRGFFAEIPVEIEEAALIDGCTRWQTLRLVLVPAILAGVTASAILAFTLLWNEFLIALFITGKISRTLPVQIHTALGFYFLDWAKLSVSTVISIIPALLFIGFAQKYIVRGLTLGAVKG